MGNDQTIPKKGDATLDKQRNTPKSGEYDEGGKIARVDITCDGISARAVIRAKYRVCWGPSTKT